MYSKIYETNHFHDIPIEVLVAPSGWHCARVAGLPGLNNLSAFATAPEHAVAALERAITGIAMHGFSWPHSALQGRYRRRQQDIEAKNA